MWGWVRCSSAMEMEEIAALKERIMGIPIEAEKANLALTDFLEGLISYIKNFRELEEFLLRRGYSEAVMQQDQWDSDPRFLTLFELFVATEELNGERGKARIQARWGYSFQSYLAKCFPIWDPSDVVRQIDSELDRYKGQVNFWKERHGLLRPQLKIYGIQAYREDISTFFSNFNALVGGIDLNIKKIIGKKVCIQLTGIEALLISFVENPYFKTAYGKKVHGELLAMSASCLVECGRISGMKWNPHP